MIYIHHHLGLGDHIICNGLVRNFQKRFSEVSVFSYHHNYNNVVQMYSDNKKIKIIPVGSDDEADIWISKNNIPLSNRYKIGFSKLYQYLSTMKFDEAFYKIAGLDFKVRFDDFYLPRDYEKEHEVYQILNPNNEPYIFLHEDASRNFLLDRTKIPTNYKIIENDTRFNIFHLIKIFENAEEIHLMQSSIKDLLNSIKINKPKIYLHNYVRNYGEELNSIGLNTIHKID